MCRSRQRSKVHKLVRDATSMFHWQLFQFVAGDCWLLAAIACVAEFPNFFKDHLFVTQEPSLSENHW